MKLRKVFQNKLIGNWDEYSSNYSFNKGLKTGQITTLNTYRNAIKIINNFFSPIAVLSSKPVFTFTSEKINISLFYYREKGELNNNSVNNLGELLTKIFNRPVKLEFVKLHYPYLNRTILAKYLRLNRETAKFRAIKKFLFRNVPIIDKTVKKQLNNQFPSEIVGVKIEISGRLMRERSVPRKTVSTRQLGSTASDNKTILVDFGSYTGKNSNGAYTIKIWIRQRVSLIKSLLIY